MNSLLRAGAALFRPAFFDQTPPPVARHGTISVLGNRLLDQNHNTVVLRGVSLFWSQWKPEFFTAETLQWLRDDWGITAVRAPLAVHHGGYAEHPRREQDKIEKIIEAAISLGIYVVVDWHSHRPEPALAADFLGSVARKYGMLPNIVYETWSEPEGQYSWKHDIKPYHARLIETIRTWDRHNLIVAGTQNWCQDVEVAANDPIRGDNIAYGLHFYAGSHKGALRDKAELALRLGLPLMVTEWGASQADGDGALDIGEARRWLQFLEEKGISHFNWSICDKLESSASLRPGASPLGGWKASNLSPAGRFTRNALRKYRSVDLG